MRRILILLALLTSCTPAQRDAWLTWFHRDPTAAADWANNECGALCTDDWDGDGVVEPEPSNDSATSNGPGSGYDGDHPDEVYDGALAGMTSCSQWADEAWAAGWRSEGYDLGRVMYAESRCDAGAF